MPSRLIAYLIGALGLAGGLWWAAHTVRQWREAYLEQPEIVAQRDAAVAKINIIGRDIERQAEENGRLERETIRLRADAAAAARDFARRLLQAASRSSRPVCPTTAPASNPDGTAGEPAGEGELGEATAAYISACDGDAIRLSALQGYVRNLPKRCVPDQ